jgi:hypothetical protein
VLAHVHDLRLKQRKPNLHRTTDLGPPYSIAISIGQGGGPCPRSLARRLAATGVVTAGEPDLLSFAAITDDPSAEVAAAGHDRIIPIKPEHVDSWLSPQRDLAAMYAILDDRGRPYYAHRLAA